MKRILMIAGVVLSITSANAQIQKLECKSVDFYIPMDNERVEVVTSPHHEPDYYYDYRGFKDGSATVGPYFLQFDDHGHATYKKGKERHSHRCIVKELEENE